MALQNPNFYLSGVKFSETRSGMEYLIDYYDVAYEITFITFWITILIDEMNKTISKYNLEVE